MESSGDPWLETPGSNAASRPYFLYAYFLTVTMSTVGYGDVIVCTASGQFLIFRVHLHLPGTPPFLPATFISLSLFHHVCSCLIRGVVYRRYLQLHSPDEINYSKQKALQCGILQCLGEIVNLVLTRLSYILFLQSLAWHALTSM